MKYIFNVSPNLRQKMSTQRIMLELMIGLFVVFAFSLLYYYQSYGVRYAVQAIKLMAASVLTALLTEIVWSFVMRKGQKFDWTYIKTFLNGSFGWITAIILTLMTPISIRPYALIVSTFIAILFGKLLFGGFGNNIFNPAALGRAIIFATFLSATTDVVTSVTPTTLIANDFNWLVSSPDMITKMMHELGGLGNLLIGWYPGAIGETSSLVILLVGVYLSIRKVIDWRAPVIYLGSIFVFAAGIALFRGVGSYGNMPGVLWYPILHVLSGGAIFGAVFMLTDPVTTPTSAQGRCIFALGAGIITMLIRIKANLPEGCLYSILMMNMLTPMIEHCLEGKQLVLRKKARIIFGCVAVVGLGSVLLASSAVQAKQAGPKVYLSTKDSEVNKLSAKIDAKKDDGKQTTYTVRAQGYAAAQDPSKYNVFSIVVDDQSKGIVSITPTKVVDTPHQGDKIENKQFLNQFKDQSLQKDVKVEKNDAVSEATTSAQSVLRAVEEVRKALGY